LTGRLHPDQTNMPRLCGRGKAQPRAGQRPEPNFGYRQRRAVYRVVRVLLPNQVIRADDLARAMVDVAGRGTTESQGPRTATSERQSTHPSPKMGVIGREVAR